MAHYECSQFAKQVDNGALKEKAKNAKMKARKQTFLEASLAASRESTTHPNREGLELPKRKEINDQEFVEKVESTCEKIYRGLEKELNIEQEKATIMENIKTEEANKELCKANPEQLFEEVATEIVDQSMKMEDTENKNEAGKEIPWLTESLKEKQKQRKKGNPLWRPGQEVEKPTKNNCMVKGKMTEQLSKKKVKGENQTKEKARTNRNPPRAKAQKKTKTKGHHPKARAKRMEKIVHPHGLAERP